MKKLYVSIVIMTIFSYQIFYGSEAKPFSIEKPFWIFDLAVNIQKNRFDRWLQNHQPLSKKQQNKKKLIEALFQDYRILISYLRINWNNPERLKQDCLFTSSRLSEFEYLQNEKEALRQEILNIEKQVAEFTRFRRK